MTHLGSKQFSKLWEIIRVHLFAESAALTSMTRSISSCHGAEIDKDKENSVDAYCTNTSCYKVTDSRVIVIGS